jgi:hypothetical protein
MQPKQVSRSVVLRAFVPTALCAMGCAVGLLAAGLTIGSPSAQAQNGITIFSGVERNQELSYQFDFGGNKGGWDRYRLKIGKDKMKLAVSSFTILYPDYYTGVIDGKDIEVKVNGKAVKLQEPNLDKDNYRLEISPLEPIAAGTNVEIALSNVKNPSNPGTFYFKCLIQAPGDVPIVREVGTWILTID